MLRGQRVALKPGVEFVVAGVELGQDVVRLQSVKTHQRTDQASWSLGFFLNSWTSSGTDLAGLSSSAMKRSKASFDSTRSWCCFTTRLARAEHERRDGRPLEIGGPADERVLFGGDADFQV